MFFFVSLYSADVTPVRSGPWVAVGWVAAGSWLGGSRWAAATHLRNDDDNDNDDNDNSGIAVHSHRQCAQGFLNAVRGPTPSP